MTATSKPLIWKKSRDGSATICVSACGRFRIDHTGTVGRSTREFTSYSLDTGKAVCVGGLKKVKLACEAAEIA